MLRRAISPQSSSSSSASANTVTFAKQLSKLLGGFVRRKRVFVGGRRSHTSGSSSSSCLQANVLNAETNRSIGSRIEITTLLPHP